MPRTPERRDKLRKLLKKTDAGALLVTGEHNVTYLTGFTGDSSYLLLTPTDELILSDKRYTTQLEEDCPDLKFEVRGPDVKILEHLGQVAKRMKLANLGFEAHIVTVAGLEAMQEAMPKTELVPTSELVEQLRMIKDKEEIKTIQASIECAERAFAVIRASLRPERTEKQVADELEGQIRLFGGECTSFPPIIAVGPRAALPHARPGSPKIGDDDFVLIDWGARLGGYASDLTRVLVTGRISPKLQKVYGVVAKAQAKAIAAMRHGVSMKDVDAAARNHIAKSGFGKYFGHGLGHGIGLQIHESPRMGPKEDAKLQAGMVVTVEPGVYLPGWGGVRIEDDVLVTRGGANVLTSTTKDLEECVVGR